MLLLSTVLCQTGRRWLLSAAAREMEGDKKKALERLKDEDMMSKPGQMRRQIHYWGYSGKRKPSCTSESINKEAVTHSIQVGVKVRLWLGVIVFLSVSSGKSGKSLCRFSSHSPKPSRLKFSNYSEIWLFYISVNSLKWIKGTFYIQICIMSQIWHITVFIVRIVWLVPALLQSQGEYFL